MEKLKRKRLVPFRQCEILNTLKTTVTLVIMIAGCGIVNASFLDNTKLSAEEIILEVITGTIKDDQGQPLAGVNVLVKGTTTGTQTDFDGNYTLDVPGGADTLVFSFLGFVTKEVNIGDKSVVNVTMTEDVSALDEVVVVGYGSVKRSDLTGSVSSIRGEDIVESPSNSIVGLLQGKAAGVQVSTGDAAPGGGINIRIRGTSTITGSTEPLYIIDGFPVNSDNDDLYVPGGYGEGSAEGSEQNKVKPNALSMINPNDIASIEILKDAAATAIYGSRGANGVVLITTKSGSTGKTKMTINYSTGVQTIIRKINRLDGPEYAARITEGELRGGVQPVNVRFNGSDQYHPLPPDVGSHNWQDLIYRNAMAQDLSVSFTGGNEKTKYYLSGKYSDQEGIMVTSGFKDAGLRFNLDQNVGEFLSLKTNIALSHTINDRVPTGAGFGYNAVTEALSYDPTINPDWFDETTGRWYLDNKISGYGFTNPIRLIQGVHDKLVTNRVIGNILADFHLTQNLTFTASTGIDYSDATRKTYIDRILTLAGSPAPNGDARINMVDATRTNSNAYFTWNNTFGEHNIDAVGGAELVSQTISDLNVGVREFATDELRTDNLSGGDPETRNISNGKTKWQTVGFFGRLNYNFRNKYYASINGRWDGSSVFGASHKWAFFPSLALAWRPTEETFMKDLDLFSNLKIRASIGQTGNGNLSPYSSIGLWNITGAAYSYDNQVVNGVSLSRISNPDLKWETTTQYNVGLDVSFLNNKLGINLDYFLKDTDDLILPVVIPSSTGFQSSIQNLGSLRNTGLELAVNAVVLDGDFHWDLNGNVSHIESEATYVGEGTSLDPNTGEPYIEVATWPRRGGPRLYEGQPAGQIYGFVIEGVFRDQTQADNWPVSMDSQRNLNKEGYWIYKDVNGDGIITDADKQSLGTGSPDFIFGLTNRFSYKSFDLSLFMQGTTGSDIFMFYGGGNDKPRFTDTWTPENRDAISAVNSTANDSRKGLVFDNLGMQDGSYLRLKNIRLGYTLPSNIGVFNELNIYLNATNVFTLTTYDGYNPDVSSGGTAAFGEGFDTGVYPLARTYTLGLNFNF